MTSIDIYLTPEPDIESYIQFATRLLEKAYQRQTSCFVLLDDQQTAHQLDEALWTYRPDTFIPHELDISSNNSKSPIRISTCSDTPQHRADCLVNLSQTIPQWFDRFNRVADVVLNHDDALAPARARYREYQARKCPIRTHDLRKAT